MEHAEEQSLDGKPLSVGKNSQNRFNNKNKPLNQDEEIELGENHWTLDGAF